MHHTVKDVNRGFNYAHRYRLEILRRTVQDLLNFEPSVIEISPALFSTFPCIITIYWYIAWAHHGPMGGPSLGQSWPHGGPKLGPIMGPCGPSFGRCGAQGWAHQKQMNPYRLKALQMLPLLGFMNRIIPSTNAHQQIIEIRPPNL
jgi:hypothetical protein